MAPTWLDDLEALPERAAPAADAVRLLDYPVALGIRQEERTIELVRELQLIALDARGDHRASSVHARLVAFATSVSAQKGCPQTLVEVYGAKIGRASCRERVSDTV